MRPHERVWEVDCLRGLAVCLMLVSNFLFDLYHFYSFGNPESGFLAYFSRAVAGLFLFIVGISLTLSIRKKNNSTIKKVVLRSAKLLSLALAISVATYFAVGDSFIIFGILHLISVSIVFGYFFLGHPLLSLVGGISVVLLGQVTKGIRLDFGWLLWLGFQPQGFVSVDYTPLIPWFGLVLFGIFAGSILYKDKVSLFRSVSAQQNTLQKSFSFLGRRSLIIYLIHQPVLWSGFYIFNKFI